MVFTVPYVTNKFTAYPGDVKITNLSLAVWLVDDFTKDKPVDSVKVIIKEGEIKTIKNLSGYYLFNDLSPGNYTVRVESDFYFPVEESVNISHHTSKNPVIEITLKSKPCYLFPSNATLVRGKVSNSGPIADAEVTVIGKTIKTITDERGEFVLYFKGIKTEGITIEIKKDGNTKSANTTIEEGRTISMGVIPFP